MNDEKKREKSGKNFDFSNYQETANFLRHEKIHKIEVSQPMNNTKNLDK